MYGNVRGSFLSFGSRRSSVVSSYGNTPTVIRRSLSSNGMIEYSIEQMGASKWKTSEPLPAITMEEKDEDDFKGMEVKQIPLRDINPPISAHEESHKISLPSAATPIVDNSAMYTRGIRNRKT